jgi:hypothetical protein
MLAVLLDAALYLAWMDAPRPAQTAIRSTGQCSPGREHDADFQPDVRYESSDLLLHVRLVEAGHAAAFPPDLGWGAGGLRPPISRTLPARSPRVSVRS